MIAVIADSAEQEVVREFFELFKTPWEFYRRDRRYDAVVCAGSGEFGEGAKLVLVYSGRKTIVEEECNIQRRDRRRARVLSRQGMRLPIYGDTITFPDKVSGLLTEE